VGDNGRIRSPAAVSHTYIPRMKRRWAVIALALVLDGCGASTSIPSNTSTPSPTRVATPSPTVIASAHESTSAAPTPAATADEAVLAVGGFADVVTTDLVVRSAPGTGADSEIYGTIEHIPAYIVAGPTQADGFEWWLVVHAHSDRLGGPPAGWVAAAGKDGEVWLAPSRPQCPEPTGFQPSMWVSCYAGMELTLDGVLGGCMDSVWPPWDNACSLYPCPDGVAPASCLDGTDLQSLTLHFDSVPDQDRGRVEVRGHFDDPNAYQCTYMGSVSAALGEFDCRTHFVVASYRFGE